MKRKSPAARFAPTTQAVPLALVLLAAMLAAGCQNINVDTEKLLSPTVSNGRADGRFVPGTSDAVTITDPNDGSTVKFSIDGGATQIYSVPITLTDDATIEAWTEKPGLVPSARTAASFRLAWRTLTTKLPAKRFTHAAVSTSDGIWISGGLADDASTRISGVLLFTTAKALVEKPDLPEGRRGHSMFAYDEDLFVIGGDTAAHTNDAKVYRLNRSDPSGEWQPTANDFEYRMNAQAVVVDDAVILPFGYLSAGAGQSWGRFHMDGTASDVLSSTYTARQGCGAVALDGVVYSIGGDGGTVTVVNRYDTVSGAWLAAETLPKTEGAFFAQGSAVALGSQIFVFSHQFTYVRQVGGGWTVDPFPVPRPVHNAAAGVMGGGIYVFGGSDYGGSTRYDTILEFTPP